MSIPIFAILTPLVRVVVAGHGGYFQIFGIWLKSILGDLLWKIICGLLVWVHTITISLWPAFLPKMALVVTLVTNQNVPGIWPSYRSTNISTVSDLEVNLLHSLVDWLIDFHSVCLQEKRFSFRLLLSGIRFPPLVINNSMVFKCSLLYEAIIGDDILWLYGIHVTHTKFIYKSCNLLLIMNFPNT